MKKNIIIIALLFISVSFAHATVWRLNNAPGTDAHFTTLQAAHDSPLVLNGDTLYLEASSGTYGNLTCSKKLTIIGAGFFTGENIGNQAIISPSVIGNVHFNNGSQGSKISGCTAPYIQINTSEIIIERNYLVRNAGDYIIVFNTSNISNIIIRNNYISNNCSNCYLSTAIVSTVSGVNNVNISNNYLKVTHTGSGTRVVNLSSGFTGLFSNNIIEGNIEINNSLVLNNIQTRGSFIQTNCTWTNNIGNGAQFGADNGNQSNVNMNSVFIGTGSTDGQWQLKEGSPAIGTGLGGVDCGMFGGAEPYILSGIPAIPAIYKFEIEVDNVEQKIDVEVSVKSNN